MAENLIYKKTAIELLGLTPNSFDKLNLTPVKEVLNPHYRKAPPSKLYDRLTIEKLIDSELVKELQPKPRKPIDYTEKFLNRYNHKSDAIEDVCFSMFNLNRYCKYDSCNIYNREEIYNLKNNLIEYLYRNNYCSKVYLHSKPHDKTCYRCKGSGVFFEMGYLDDCYDCEGTGNYLGKTKLKFFVFSFDINGTVYTWHQPDHLIKFDVKKIDYEEEINPTSIEPIEMKSGKFKEAKELIRWFLNQ